MATISQSFQANNLYMSVAFKIVYLCGFCEEQSMKRDNNTITFENINEVNSVLVVLKQYDIDHPDRPMIGAKILNNELTSIALMYED